MANADYLMRRFTKDPSMVSRNVAGECILVPIRHRIEEVAGIYTLNEVGAHIWGLIDGKKSVAELRDAVIAEFDVTAAQAEEDLVTFLTELQQIQAIAEN